MGNRKYIVHEEDRLSKAEEVPLCAGVKIPGRDDRDARNLEEIEIVVGMKMIVMNVSTEANITNAIQGVIELRRYWPTSHWAPSQTKMEQRVHLKYPPVMVLFSV
jgi:hypothetical protein